MKKKSVQKIKALLLYCAPIPAMIGLIMLVEDDILLTLIYCGFIAALLSVKRERHDIAALLFGLIGITVSEYIFVSTGVETFSRRSLFGVMPLWLPFLWAYAFVTIKRVLRVLDA